MIDGEQFEIGAKMHTVGHKGCESCLQGFPVQCTRCGKGLVHATDDFLKSCDKECGEKNYNYEGMV